MSKKIEKFIQSRRDFIKKTALVAAAVPALGLTSRILSSTAHASGDVPAGMKPVAETDPVANAIGYKQDVKNIDKKKYPKRKPTEFCNNCALYTKANAGWGKCSMLTSGVVSAKGWCGSWNKKS